MRCLGDADPPLSLSLSPSGNGSFLWKTPTSRSGRRPSLSASCPSPT